MFLVRGKNSCEIGKLRGNNVPAFLGFLPSWPEGGKNIIITAPLPFPPIFVTTNLLGGPFPPR